MHEDTGSGIYCYLCGAGYHSVQLKRNIYRSAYGSKLGRFGGSFPGAVFIRTLLEENYEDRLLVQLCVLNGVYDNSYLSAENIPARFAPVAYKFRRILYVGGACHCAFGEHFHKGSEQGKTDGYLLVL